ncbi:MAG: DsbA family oxidoreductase [Streptosporangiaceae bacterium]|jgi:predicted DsbA family dithiol-disulfide isomerase
MRVDIWSDVVCPWCYLGKARFAKAVESFSGPVEVVHRSFELDPGWPAGESVSVNEMLSRKFGMPPEAARQAEERVAGLARAEGLGFQVERPYGNTFDVHRVMHAGGDAAREAIDHAYFAEGRDIFDPAVLNEVTGITLNGDDFADEVRGDERTARDLGVTGVPFFVFDGRLAVSGAQPTQTFAEALREIQ